MKLKLLFLLFFTSLSSFAQYTLIPDVNFENKLISLHIDYGYADGKVLTSSISSLTSLDVSSAYITDLTGIQDFKNLTSLRCHSNQLTTLDVSNNTALTVLFCLSNQLTTLDVSKNTALTNLNCYSNQLTTLDVSKNTALKYLYCNNNKLMILDVSMNTALTELDCYYNQLTTLDVSKNTALTRLACYNNQLISLNLKNGKNTKLVTANNDFKYNPNLSCIQVDDIAYSNANWTSAKDATANYSGSCQPLIGYTLIPDLNFEKKLLALSIDSGLADGYVLTGSISSLTSLDVSSASIKDLTGIQDFRNLTSLKCNNNTLINLDISKNTALTTLNCYSNQLTTLDISKNTTLTTLNCYSNQLTTLDVSKNSALTSLDCSANQLTFLDISMNTALKSLNCSSSYSQYQLTTLDVSKNIALTSLDCNYNKLTTLDVSKNIALTSLDCNYNKLTTLDVSKNTALTGLKCTSNQLLSLNLRNGKNTILGIYNIDFKYNPNLSCIQVDDVAYANAKWAGAKDAVATYSIGNCAYTLIPDINFEKKLIARGIDIGSADGKVLTESISSLTSLDVSLVSLNNSFGDIKDLTGIQDFTNLTSLNCHSNQLTTLDVSKNTALTSLDCSSNRLTILDVSKNTALTSLDCSTNSNYSQLTALDVSKNTALTSLDCSFNKLKALDVSKNTSLTSLNCSYNQLTTLDVSKNTALAGIQCYSNQLTTLDVSENTALKLLFCYSNQLTTLDISKNTSLTRLILYNNQLISLNLKNGNNTKLDINDSNFINNPNLSCIQVDNVAYSNENWYNLKDPKASYSVNCPSLGIAESIFDKAAIYPNPTKGELHIDNAIVDKATIYNVLGKLVKTKTFTNSSNNTIDLAGSPTGVYYIYLENQGNTIVKKIVIE
jgi:Leucine-rich repeat (LRR) protein